MLGPDPSSLAMPALGTPAWPSSVLCGLAIGVLAGAQGNPNRIMASEDEEQVPGALEASLPALEKHLGDLVLAGGSCLCEELKWC